MIRLQLLNNICEKIPKKTKKMTNLANQLAIEYGGRKYLTTANAAKVRGVSPKTTYFWTKKGLPHIKLGRDILIEVNDLLAYQPKPVGSPNRKPKKVANRHADNGSGGPLCNTPHKVVIGEPITCNLCLRILG